MSSSIFHHIIGQKRVLSVLDRLTAAGTLPHALLLVGPHQTGKRLIAHQLMSFLLDGANPEIHPDALILRREEDEKTGKQKTHISVEQVRELCERMAMSGLHGGWKVAFVEEVDKLSIAAANAFLKTLEEPSGKTLFILRAPSTESVMKTILSRCQVLRVSPCAKEELSDALVRRGFDKVDARVAAARSFGRPGRAVRWLTKSEDRLRAEVEIEQARTLFSASPAQKLKRVSVLLPKEDIQKRLVAEQMIHLWQGLLRDELLQQVGCEDLMVYRDPADPVLRDPSILLRALHELREGQEALAHNTNPQLTLEHMLFSV